jgi:hypothetical protein
MNALKETAVVKALVQEYAPHELSVFDLMWEHRNETPVPLSGASGADAANATLLTTLLIGIVAGAGGELLASGAKAAAKKLYAALWEWRKRTNGPEPTLEEVEAVVTKHNE